MGSSRCAQENMRFRRTDQRVRDTNIFKGESMTVTKASKTAREASSKHAIGRLFVLDLSGGRIFTANPDGSERKVIVTGCHLPDGIVVDAEAGHIYWTSMGNLKLNDGTIERADLDGQNRKTIIP